MFSVKDRIVMVTGAAGGIGLEIVKVFAREGAQVIAVDNSEKLSAVETQVKDYTHKPVFFKLDLLDSGQVDEMLMKLAKIDVLVNAAGVNRRKVLEEYTETDYDLILSVNTKAIFSLSNKVAKIMKNNKFGRIINISSIQGFICWNGKGRFSLGPYCASKAALQALTRAFALDLARHGITVNAICPAFVDTPLVRVLKEDAELYNDIVSRTPLGRFATTEEIAAPVLFLASEESSFITGHSLLVDGGWTIE